MISRTATINASILRKNISFLLGMNAIDCQTGTVSQITSSDLKPQFAVNITEQVGFMPIALKSLLPNQTVKLSWIILKPAKVIYLFSLKEN